MPDWLLQSLFSRVVWEVLLMLGVGGVLGYLKANMPELAPRILYGLASATCVGILLFAFTGRAILSKAPPEITVDNVEQNIRTWLDTFKVGEQVESDETAYFTYAVTLANGNHVIVARSKGRDHYITFTASVMVSADHASLLAKMDANEAQQIEDEVDLDLAMFKIGRTMIGSPLKGVLIIKSVPITSSLTESEFASALDEMDNGLAVARQAIRTSIGRRKNSKLPS
jgi:hypothetical protein